MKKQIKFFDIEQNSEEWGNIRLGKFTASTFDDLFKEPSSVGYKKAISKIAYERVTGESYDHFTSKRMEAGHDLENLARQHYEACTFNDVLNGGFWALNDWVGCSPDGRVEPKGGVEFKSRDPHIYFEYVKNGKLPTVNMWQVYGQLYVTGWDWIDYMPYCHPKLKTLIIRVEPDVKIFKQLDEKLEQCIEAAEKQIKIFTQ
jgi:hypothetical protein